MSEEDLKIIEKINGDKDTKSFAESNKSLMTGPKRNVYKEYSLDINFYAENFDIVKSKLKGKTPKEQREILKQLSIEITGLISNLIKEEPNEINVRIEQIAKDIKENRKNLDFVMLFNEPKNFAEVLCKPKLLPLKSITIRKLEELDKEFEKNNNANNDNKKN